MTQEELNELNEEIEKEVSSEPAEETTKEAPKKEKKESKKHKKEIEELNAKLAEQEDKYLRVVAEYDNFRRRAREEKDACYRDAYADAIKEILPVIDNLERAAAFKDNDKVSEGVALTLNQFKATLEKMGVEEIAAEPGTPFDPNFHNAVMHCEDESLGESVVAEVFQKGYIKGDKVIRYTMCKVAN
ncbi:MAG: nucleotide exchange factor GrpE [Clostridia bacterium]|nr:nucleotide exchange factor GrpE [Clostridia bacterium]